MQFDTIAVLSIIFSSLVPSTLAVQCGKWYSTKCLLADEDKRYDEDYPNDIVYQNNIWEDFSGYWILTERSYDENGDPQQPTPFNPRDISGSVGVPYTRSERKKFYNNTIVGSRLYEHSYSMFAPAPQSFCDEPLEPGYMNSLNGGTCGVNGYATYVDTYRVSTYEKDGSIEQIITTLGYVFQPKPEPSSGYSIINGNRTIFTQQDGASSGGTASVSDTFQFTNADKTTATENVMNFNTANEVSLLTSMQTRQYTKVTKEEWLAAIEAAWEEYKVQPMNRGGNGVLPMATDCLAGNIADGKCPTEEDWCAFDPSCSESPYQEPSASLLAGPIVGIVVACFAVLLGGLYVLYKKKMAAQVERVKSIFARQIASNVSSLDMDDLAKEFKRIDTSGDGLLNREELRVFISENSLMPENDFEAMFSILDGDNSGEISYTEFVAFINMCRDKFEENGIREA